MIGPTERHRHSTGPIQVKTTVYTVKVSSRLSGFMYLRLQTMLSEIFFWVTLHFASVLPYLYNASSDPVRVWFYGGIFGVGGSNGATYGWPTSKMAAGRPVHTVAEK